MCPPWHWQAMAASGGGGELENYLQCIQQDTWSSVGIIQLLTDAGLEQLDASWARFDRLTKVRCLLSFMHAKSTYVEKHAKVLQSVIDRSLADADHWVMGLARLLNGFPDTGKVPCEQVDNELINYRLMEALDKAGAHRTTPNLAQSSLPWSTAAAVALRDEPRRQDAVDPDAWHFREGPRCGDCTFVGGSAEECFKWIREGDAAEQRDLNRANKERSESPINTSRQPAADHERAPSSPETVQPPLSRAAQLTRRHSEVSAASSAAVPGRGMEPASKDWLGQAVPAWARHRPAEGHKDASHDKRGQNGQKASAESRKRTSQGNGAAASSRGSQSTGADAASQRPRRRAPTTSPKAAAPPPSPLLQEVPADDEDKDEQQQPTSPAAKKLKQDFSGMPVPLSMPASHGPQA